jgi:hypothetical protein
VNGCRWRRRDCHGLSRTAPARLGHSRDIWINAAFSFWHEFRTEHALEVLQQVLPAQARVQLASRTQRDKVGCAIHVPAATIISVRVSLQQRAQLIRGR